MHKFEDIRYNINIRDIKSAFIIKLIFSFLSEKQILNMIIYNKELQKIFSVDIDNYIKKSGKYKIVEINGKGKEYIINTNLLIFEGEYINGEKNGKGKEYFKSGKLKFEGEYINGKKNGKGKEYLKSGKLKFEGEYLNGERNGKGKKFYKSGKLIFEGEYINGKRWNGKGYNLYGNEEFEIKNGNGKGKDYYNDGKLIFEGEYINGERNGKR